MFISYSWSSPGHRSRIRQLAEQMVSDGIDVILDIWDLKEGDDKYAFMEKMVTDESVTHVLIFSDSDYAKKADARKAGVGTESQIISHGVFSKIQQSKFIPIACELDDSGEPFLPNFLKSRIWIDFSSIEAEKENWEQLIRVLYGKPAYVKPTLGKAPTCVTSDVTVPASPAVGKFAALKQAITQEKPGVKLYRKDFLDACYTYADALRVRERPDVTNMGVRVLEDCGKLKLVRDHIVDWILLESEVNPSEDFGEAIIEMLEHLIELKSRPKEVDTWNNTWFEAHGVFVYETFLYIIAALLKTGSFESLHLIFSSHYLLPETASNGVSNFDNFSIFHGHSEALHILNPEGKRFTSPTAELIKRQATRRDLPFVDAIQAESLILMMAMIIEGVNWYPQTLLYSSNSGAFPFFLRATRHRDFQNLATITGIGNADELREVLVAGLNRLKANQWNDFWIRNYSFLKSMNINSLDTIA
ncbi:MAG: TIR domain-containing protein [Candidatus Hydrogenedens sp.]|nr:TIR domain-containing protein [Candidatus Hydrogenedentota bacterium]NLF56439.1 TIR domain-containing protein [Candidatus Hydrogenedens sp.]